MRNKVFYGFAPGHISAFFAPHIEKDLLRTGSYGAGVSILHGARAEMSIKQSETTKVCFSVNGKPANLLVSEYALKSILANVHKNYEIHCELKHMLPVSQGFGMSAAGTLASAIALCMFLKKPYRLALEATHCAEVKFRTGLGDVAGMSAGGYEARVKPGIPPYGIVDRILNTEQERRLLICIIGKSIATKKVLSDEKMVEKCRRAGKEALKKLMASVTVRNLIAQGYEFALKTGLISGEVEECVGVLHKNGIQGSMAMLGNSVFALPPPKKWKKALEILGNYGEVIETEVYLAF